MIGFRAILRIAALLGLQGIFASFLTGTCAAQSLQPLFTIDVAPLHAAGAGIGSVTFLSSHTLAVAVCLHARLGCEIETIDFSTQPPRSLSGVVTVDHFHAMRRSPDGEILLTGVRRGGVQGCIRFDLDLRSSQWTTLTPEMTPQCVKLPAGEGRPFDTSATAVAFLGHGVLTVESLEGSALARFTVDVPDNEIPDVLLLGSDRILIERSGRPEILDYRGRLVRKLARPDQGWGRDLASSRDGNRVLFDVLTRRLGWTARMKEDLLLVPTLGLSADGDAPNGELVRVIDTESGKGCAEWRTSPDVPLLLGRHADIDPSGHLVAILADSTVSIFGLPTTCDLK